MKTRITLDHGAGGKYSRDLAQNLIARIFSNPLLQPLSDAAILGNLPGKLAFTTDSFVISPIFFPGGNIGKLAVAGTVNDLAVMGARPKFLSCGLILEEGLEIDTLKMVLETMASEAQKSGAMIVCGDTKVVERGKTDRIYINTSGIGILEPVFPDRESIQKGDLIIISGTLGDHEAAIVCARGDMKLETSLSSDCASLTELIFLLLEKGIVPKWMRDPTRGGVASALHELVETAPFGVLLTQQHLPIKPEVGAVCDLLGFDPLYLANEGKVLLVMAPERAPRAMELLRSHPLGKDAAVIGKVTDDRGRVSVSTGQGGTRIIDMMVGGQIPRIC